ncbi:hypothetical protein [Nonomuraea sp. NPDC005692]|uniref:hypothetical protein n=1 Tax=Nonomuraea sp. NPDC005692 TaxID=3157168 RepID=UPI003400D5F6
MRTRAGGAFGAFAGFDAPARAFWQAYRRAAGRALAVWAAGAAAVSVLVVDATWVPPVLVPFFVTAATLVAATVLTLLVLIAEPAGTVRGLVRPASIWSRAAGTWPRPTLWCWASP